MLTAKLTSKGQMTLPKPIRESLGLESGDRVSFRVREDGVVELRPPVDLMTLCGSVRSEVRGVTVEDMAEAVRKGATGG